MAALFAEFDEQGGRGTWTDAVVRPFRPSDGMSCAALVAARHGWSAERALESVSRWVDGKDRVVLVAERQGTVEGFGKAEWLEPTAEGGDAPSGWYLTGVVVDAPARRHGLGSRLTEERIRRLQPVADDIRFCVNLRNRASIALHERYGFRLETTDFRIPGVTFEGGRGGLYRLGLDHS